MDTTTSENKLIPCSLYVYNLGGYTIFLQNLSPACQNTRRRIAEDHSLDLR